MTWRKGSWEPRRTVLRGKEDSLSLCKDWEGVAGFPPGLSPPSRPALMEGWRCVAGTMGEGRRGSWCCSLNDYWSEELARLEQLTCVTLNRLTAVTPSSGGTSGHARLFCGQLVTGELL